MLRAPAGTLPAPILPLLLPLLHQGEDLVILDEQAGLLMRMSAATIDLVGHEGGTSFGSSVSPCSVEIRSS